MTDDEKKKIDEVIEQLDSKVRRIGAVAVALMDVIQAHGIASVGELSARIEIAEKVIEAKAAEKRKDGGA